MAFFVSCLVGCVIFIRGISTGPVVMTNILNADVFQTGIAEYAMYPSVQALNISCDISRLPIDGTVELLHGTSLVQNNIVPAGSPSRFIFTFLLPTDLPDRNRLTCQLQVSSTATLTSGSLNYVVEDSVGVIVWPTAEESRCISDIGNSATSRETATLTCIKVVPFQRLNDIEFGWRGFDRQIKRRLGDDRAFVRAEVHLSGSTVGELACVDPTTNEVVCRLRPLEVTSDPTISITPANNFVSRSDSLEFTCISDPPAPIQWFVFGDFGDILDNSLETIVVPESELSISITSNGGTSRLRVTGITVQHSNIHTVMCTTDGRGYFRVAVSQKEQSDGTTILVPESDQSTQGSTTDGQANVSPVYIILIVILVVIVLGLLVACVLLCLGAKRAGEKDQSEDSAPYASYRPAAASSQTYMDINQPVVPPRVENEYTKTDHQGYQIPKT